MDKEAPTVPKVEAVPEDISIQHEQPHQHQHYHSPSINETHASFFPGDRALDTTQDQQAEPPTPPQRASRPDVAAEDLQLGSHGDDQIQQLQLAAQMSQALQGVVGSSAPAEENNYEAQQEPNLSISGLQQLQDEEADTEMHSPGDSLTEAHGMPELPDTLQPSIQQELQQTLEQVIQNPERHHGSEPQHTPQPTPSQHAQYIDNSLQQPILAPAGGGAQSQYAFGDNTPPRKRSKVSRACDECRRKKIKCDATTESGDEICSNCRRSNVRCLFSRVPQKRGPSKGYIKELADRINSIEGKLGGQSVAEALAGELASRRNLGERYAASAHGEDVRKRPYSNISGSTIPTPTPSRQPGWPSDSRPGMHKQTPHSANGLHLKPILPREHIATTPSRTLATDTVRAQAPQLPTSSQLVEDSTFYAYLNNVHHVLPFLPSSKDILVSHLAQCSPTLCLAFKEAFVSAMGSFVALATAQGSLTAYRLLAEFETEGSKRTETANLVYLQCLILLIINVDNSGPTSLTEDHIGPDKATLLGQASGRAYSMGIPHESMTLNPVGDDETDQYIRVRAWWALVILDRWNAMSTASSLIIPADAVVLPHNLKPILGEASYHFTLLAYIMGHWAPLSVCQPVVQTPGAAARASATFHLNMEMWRVQFPSDIHPSVEPVLHLTYWHCRLLAFLFMPSSLITDVKWAVRESVRLLTTHTQMLSPLNHHFTALTTLCLIEMSKAKDSREEASQLLSNLEEANIAPSTWDDAIRAKIRDALRPRPSSSSEAAASQSLQHLADLATATNDGMALAPAAEMAAVEQISGQPKFRTSDDYEDLGFDPRELLRTGYLHAITQLSSEAGD